MAGHWGSVKAGPGRALAALGGTWDRSQKRAPGVWLGKSGQRTVWPHQPGAPPAMTALLILISMVINLLIWLLIINAVLSWLLAFDVVNRSNRLVNTIWDFTNRLTEPLLRPLRKVIPQIGGIDLSPMVLILGLIFLDNLVKYDLPKYVS
jgi:YggT family protein